MIFKELSKVYTEHKLLSRNIFTVFILFQYAVLFILSVLAINENKEFIYVLVYGILFIYIIYNVYRKDLLGHIIDQMNKVSVLTCFVLSLCIVPLISNKVLNHIDNLTIQINILLVAIFIIFFLSSFLLLTCGIFFFSIFSDKLYENNYSWATKKNLTFMLILLFAIQAFRYISQFGDTYTITLLSFSYSYGFIPRGLIGTALTFICSIFGQPLSLNAMAIFSYAGTFIFVLIVIEFFLYVFKKTKTEESKKNIIILMLFFAGSFGFSTYLNDLGRTDIYMIILSIISCVLVIENKALFLIIPLTACCLLIHQGYVFLYFNIVLVLLLYRSFLSGGFSRKHFIILLTSFFICSVLFVYLQFFSHVINGITYEIIFNKAADIMGKTNVHESIIKQELFNVSYDYRGFVRHNAVELLIAIVLFCPYLVFCFMLWKKVIGGVTNAKEKILYIMLPLGILTTLPLFAMHIDYGRWCYSVFFYEIFLLLTMSALDDSNIIKAFNSMLTKLRNKPIIHMLSFIYLFLAGPFLIVHVNKYSYMLYQYLLAQ